MHLPVFTSWDWLLVVVVTCQATCVAYLHHPILKVLALCLPFPFTVAMLALDLPLDVTNIAAFGLLLIFYHVVRTAYRKWRWPILLAILLALVLHLGMASTLCKVLPRTRLSFLLTSVLVFGGASALHIFYPRQNEEGYSTPLPVWIKMPAIALVTLGIVIIKGQMQGFITGFPMVGLIAAYEGRFVLGTICRQMPILILTMFPMVLTIYFCQPHMGYAWALVPAWIVFLSIQIPVVISQWRHHNLQNLR